MMLSGSGLNISVSAADGIGNVGCSRSTLAAKYFLPEPLVTNELSDMAISYALEDTLLAPVIWFH